MKGGRCGAALHEWDEERSEEAGEAEPLTHTQVGEGLLWSVCVCVPPALNNLNQAAVLARTHSVPESFHTGAAAAVAGAVA